MAWKEVAIESMGVSLLQFGLDASAAVDVAGSAINLVDECQKKGIDPKELIRIVTPFKRKAIGAINAVVQEEYEVEDALIAPIALFLLDYCEQHGVETEVALDEAREHLSAEGWKG